MSKLSNPDNYLIRLLSIQLLSILEYFMITMHSSKNAYSSLEYSNDKRIALRTRTKNSIIDEMDCGIIHTHITNHIV